MTPITTSAGSQRSTICLNLIMSLIEPQINDILIKQNNDWLYFSRPNHLFSIHVLEDVIPTLHEIERLIQVNHWYASGFLSYEAAPAFDKAHQTRPHDDFPLLWFGLYPAPRIITLPKPDSTKPNLSWLPTTGSDTYNHSIDQVKKYIAQGQTYQVNYTMRLQSAFNSDPWNFFLHLAESQNNHAAYVNTERYTICSASPELFFHLDGDTITGRPMKGTVKRGRTTAEDKEKAVWLHNSEKNRAENVMIVDMIRNDLGRIAKIGSVHVPELFTTEKYPTLWQMTSTVEAKTKASLTEIFTALFPCASITGAPKVSTMRIISELETTPRRIYTGSIGYIAPDRKATFNVAIRTALIDKENHSAEYGIGGGIVWDSTSTDEYAEALLKARVLTESPPEFSLLETMLWMPKEGYFLRDKHTSRLLDSADYFDFSTSREKIERYLSQLASQYTSPQRVRLLLDKKGNLTSEEKPYQSSGNQLPIKISLAKRPVSSENVFLMHKTTNRDMYESARKDFPDCDDVLLYNEHGELTEFTIGNLVVEMDGKFYTPPTSCGLLAGTFREHLLETGKVQEKVIRVDEIKDCQKVFLVNSVRCWQNVDLV